MSEKKISCFAQGLLLYPPRSRPEESGKQDPATGKTKFHKYENTEYSHYYLYTERQALTTNPRADFGREGKLCLSHQSSAELMR